jgi:hypothetical protein
MTLAKEQHPAQCPVHPAYALGEPGLTIDSRAPTCRNQPVEIVDITDADNRT